LEFKEATLHNCEPDGKVGIFTITYKLRNICFVQGLCSNRVQKMVWSRNHDNFDEIAKTATE
jgi:hypothetical protein